MQNIIFNIKRFTPVALVLVLGIYFLIAHISYSMLDDKDRIRLAIQEMTEATNSRDANDILKHVSSDYRDAFHGDFERLRKGVSYFCWHYREVRASVKVISICEDESKLYTADVNVSLLAGTEKGQEPTDNILNLFTRNVPLRLTFKNEDGNWRIITTEKADIDE